MFLIVVSVNGVQSAIWFMYLLIYDLFSKQIPYSIQFSSYILHKKNIYHISLIYVTAVKSNLKLIHNKKTKPKNFFHVYDTLTYITKV